jgi:predicted DNA-binding transcriptional regulator AlpA
VTSKAAQVACAQKAPPEFIAANLEHNAKAGLEDQHLPTRPKHNHVPAARGPPAALERLNRAKKAAPTRLLCKVEVLAIAGVSFPTIWAWMRDGKFPRARIVGGVAVN